MISSNITLSGTALSRPVYGRRIVTEIENTILKECSGASSGRITPYSYRPRPVGAHTSVAHLPTEGNEAVRKPTNGESPSPSRESIRTHRLHSRPNTRNALGLRDGKILLTETAEKEISDDVQSTFFNAIVFRKSKKHNNDDIKTSLSF
jgi:hypothetical protein